MSRQLVGSVDGAIPAHLAHGGDARAVGGTQLPTPDAVPRAYGPDWVDAPRACHGTLKSSGGPCPTAPVEGEDFCVGHLRSVRREATRKAE